jgi:hypothetical protein
MIVELILSPIGLMMRCLGGPRSSSLAMEEVVFELAMLGPGTNGHGAFDFYHLMLRQRPPPRPP